MNKEIVLQQPNVITQARYLFSDTEMKILIFIIEKIQIEMNRNQDFEANKTLFGEIDYKIFFYLSEIDEEETNLKRIKKALKDLRYKDFEVDNEKEWFNVGLINYGAYNKDAKKWELQVSHKLMPYMIHLAIGYTQYQLETVLKLNTHAQRLYMMFSQYHDTGVFKISADRLRDMLALNNKYSLYKAFKNRVIMDSIEQINTLFERGKSDIFIKLADDTKKRGAEDWDRTLDFRISYTKRVYKQQKEEKDEYMRYIGTVLRSIYKDNEKVITAIFNSIVKNGKIKPFADRLARIEDLSEQEKKGLSAYAGLVRTIARNDFNVIV